MPNITVCVSVDWEGENLEGVGALQEFNKQFDIPITHFVSAAYLSRKDEHGYPADTMSIVKAMTSAIKEADEVALHLHCWKSLGQYTDGASCQVFKEEEEGGETLKYANQVYRDSGFDIALPSLSTADIKLLFNNSMTYMVPLLDALSASYKRNYTIKGFRSGGWLADDKVFNVLRSAKGLVYDASAVDWQFRKRASFEYVFTHSPMVEAIAKLWGPDTTAFPWGEEIVLNIQNWRATSGSGVSRLTGPYKIGNLIELPNNGMLIDAVTAADVENFLNWSLAQPENRHTYLSVGFHQEGAADYIKDVIEVIRKVSQEPQIRWMTHAEYALELKGSQPQGSPVRGLTKGIGQFG